MKTIYKQSTWQQGLALLLAAAFYKILNRPLKNHIALI